MPDNPDFSRAQSQSAALRRIAVEKLASRRLLRRMSTAAIGQMAHRLEPRARAHERWALVLLELISGELRTREFAVADDQQ